ncbi:hypothetical protein ACRALDRAFT_1071748, partial [Sodiomyces alcalophilus JCM 7366]|uniref:uncharacterized protein n=1 Tax=Sodiomyces alcalophilus JCM 7366 TaxID=591952 RepID=UPI0039B61388
VKKKPYALVRSTPKKDTSVPVRPKTPKAIFKKPAGPVTPKKVTKVTKSPKKTPKPFKPSKFIEQRAPLGTSFKGLPISLKDSRAYFRN